MMYFSKARRQTFNNVSTLSICALLIISLFILLPWLHPVACFKGSPFTTTGLCRHLNSDWNLFYHLGGNGPWIPRKSVGGLSGSLPESCSVTQIHLLARHAERFPTRNAGSRHIALLERMRASEHKLRGSLAFVRKWDYFTDLQNPTFENLTSQGPYAGTRQAMNTGKRLRAQYAHLIPSASSTNFWTCGSPRDVETAKNFAEGFFGHDWEPSSIARLHVIPETAERGANTLTPSDTCIKYREDKTEGHDYGYLKLAQWQETFSQSISSRLARDAGGLKFTPIEIYGMMEMCGFEILARGSSPWCEVFTHEEWLQFEYARDLLHFYRAGPGNKYAGTMGWVWLNATLRLLGGTDSQNSYFSFVHDSDIVAVVAAMGILDEPNVVQTLPVDRVKGNRHWKTSDLVPMGGFLLFERVTCTGIAGSQESARSYVRLLINDAVFDLEDVIGSSGLVGASTLEQFEIFVRKKGEEFGDFADVCGLSADSPAKMTLFEP